MIHKEHKGIQWLEYELLSDIPELFHGTFLRHGGLSGPPFESLNLAYGIGDKDEAVDENLKKTQQIIDCQKLHWAKQTHGVHLHRLDHKSPQIIHSCDGFLSNTLEIACLIKHADCQAALFYDPINKAYANVHAGWRGSVANIYAKTVHSMNVFWGTRPENLLVCISPSLGPKNAEFIHYRQEFPEYFWQFQDKENFFNFWNISHHQLSNLGILDHHMEFAKICTYSNAADCYSFRRDKGSGRHATTIYLKAPSKKMTRKLTSLKILQQE